MTAEERQRRVRWYRVQAEEHALQAAEPEVSAEFRVYKRQLALAATQLADRTEQDLREGGS